MNGTIGEIGLVPSTLVSGISTRFLIITAEQPTQKEIMGALKSPQTKMKATAAECGELTALTCGTTPAAD